MAAMFGLLKKASKEYEANQSARYGSAYAAVVLPESSGRIVKLKSIIVKEYHLTSPQIATPETGETAKPN
jgi:hypothetical protein